MSSILSIKNLTIKINDKTFFNKFNLDIEKKSFTSIIGINRSGKTMLTKVICAIIPTFNNCKLSKITLNKDTVLKYITKLGIVSNDFNNQFLFIKVKDELYYPLSNLGYKDNKIQKRINYLLDLFEINELIDKDIKDLNKSDKIKLLIVLSLLHNPKILIIDDIFKNIDNNTQEFILKKLEYLNKKGLTILNITSKLDTVYLSNKIFILNNFKIEKELTKDELFNYNNLNKLGLEIPFIINLSLNLKQNNIIDKIYYNTKELEKTIWK